MPELIDRGYIYIAQPPLYKVKKGKQEQYLKDDHDLNNYFLQSALDNASLFVSTDAPPLTGESLESLSRDFLAVMASIGRLSMRYDASLLEKLIYLPRLDEAMIEERTTLRKWVEELEGRLNTDLGIAESCILQLLNENGADDAGILLTRKIHGIGNERIIPFDFFSSVEYRKITELGNQLSGLLTEDAYVRRGEKEQPVSSFRQALDWLMEDAKKGQHVQRYKGLGEMNPDQLWETTMNADSRRLLQVSIEDAVAADQIFSTLMGDQVEPRREFIETHALTVENLDI
jgi:DNA gyrase subunit B